MSTRLKRPRIGVAFVMTLVVAGLAANASAHHRDFTFLRDWYLPYKGEQEIESRTTFIGKDNNFVLQEFEFEYGITKNFAIEPGVGVTKADGEKWHVDAWDVELRFNFLDFEVNKILPAVNVEYENPSAVGEPDHGEIKFILSYYTAQGENFSLNLNIGQELSGPKEKEGEILFGYARPIGRSTGEEGGYNLGWRGGFESVYDFQEHNIGLGPVLIARVNEHLNAVATFMFGLNHRDAFHDILKLILEWEF